MFNKESGQSAELKSDHGDVDEIRRVVDCPLVVTQQPALKHQPAELALKNPAAWQYFEFTNIVRWFDRLEVQHAAAGLNPVGKGAATVAAIHPQQPDRIKPPKHLAKECKGPIAIGRIAGCHHHGQHQTKSVHQHMAFGTFDAFSRIETNAAPMPGGFDTLTVQDRRRGSGLFGFAYSDHAAQSIIEDLPLTIDLPAADDPIDGLPGRRIRGVIPPLNASLDDIKDGVKVAVQISNGSSAMGGLGGNPPLPKKIKP